MREIAVQLSPGHTFVYKQPTHSDLAARPVGLEFSEPIESVERWRGYRLPLRVEFNIDEPSVFYDLVDADHRRVAIEGDFDQLRELMFAANATARRYNAYRGMVSYGPNLTYVERLSNLHPCDRTPVRLGLVFECMIFRAHTGWITAIDLFELQGFGVLNPDMTPQRRYVERWHDWRLAENAALARREAKNKMS